MSYLVLARKWRPQKFSEVIGQPHVTKTLQNAIRFNRVAHAYLFTGARGVGKTSVARIFAKSLNCLEDAEVRPCNACSNCEEITRGNSVDVIEIDGASNRGIDSIRELRETVRYRPAKSRHKIYIIDEVHMLTAEAFNALLKTLEEPPEHVIFIFATTEPHKILPTILSRCQRFDFRRIATSKIAHHLKEISGQEGVSFSDEIIYSIAHEADGSMRDAQSLLEQLLAFSTEGLPDTEILDLLGIVDRKSVRLAAKAIMQGDVEACIKVVDDLYRRGIDCRRFCQQLCEHFRNLLFWSLQEGEENLLFDLPAEEIEWIRNEAGTTTPESLHLYFQAVLKGQEDIRRSSLPKLSLEMLLVSLARLPRLQSLQALLEKVNVLERAVSGVGGARTDALLEPVAERASKKPQRKDKEGEDPPQVRTETAPHQSAPAPLPAPGSDPAEHWGAFVGWLHGKDPVLAAKLEHSRIRIGSQSSVELEVLDIYEDALKEPQNLSKLGDLAGTFLGGPVKWDIKGKPSLNSKKKTPASSKGSKAAVRRMVMTNPVVQQALEILGGELVEIRSLKPSRPEDETGSD